MITFKRDGKSSSDERDGNLWRLARVTSQCIEPSNFIVSESESVFKFLMNLKIEASYSSDYIASLISDIDPESPGPGDSFTGSFATLKHTFSMQSVQWVESCKFLRYSVRALILGFFLLWFFLLWVSKWTFEMMIGNSWLLSWIQELRISQ